MSSLRIGLGRGDKVQIMKLIRIRFIQVAESFPRVPGKNIELVLPELPGAELCSTRGDLQDRCFHFLGVKLRLLKPASRVERLAK